MSPPLLSAVSDRTLRSSCAEFLGMNPTQYVPLRRPKEVRGALREADPNIVNVADVAHRFGFTQLGRFAGRYLARPRRPLSNALRNALRLSVNFSNFCIVGSETDGLG